MLEKDLFYWVSIAKKETLFYIQLLFSYQKNDLKKCIMHISKSTF